MPGYERDKQSRCLHHLMLAWQNGYVPGFQPGYGGSIPSVSSKFLMRVIAYSGLNAAVKTKESYKHLE